MQEPKKCLYSFMASSHSWEFVLRQDHCFQGFYGRGTMTKVIQTEAVSHPSQSWDIRNQSEENKAQESLIQEDSGACRDRKAEPVLFRQMGAHWTQLNHQLRLSPPSPASLQTNSRPYLIKKDLDEEVNSFLIPSTGIADRSKHKWVIADGQ